MNSPVAGVANCGKQAVVPGETGIPEANFLPSRPISGLSIPKLNMGLIVVLSRVVAELEEDCVSNGFKADLQCPSPHKSGG